MYLVPLLMAAGLVLAAFAAIEAVRPVRAAGPF